MSSKKQNLWTDVEALFRLARSGRDSEQSEGKAISGVPRPRDSYPHFPDRDEFDIHARGSAAHGVTGDAWDFRFVSDDTLVFSLADVSGKGVPAALLTGVTRSIVGNLTPVCSSPGDTLTRVNQILYQTELDSMFVTIFLGWYDTRSGRLRYANAGHPLPCRIDGRGQVETTSRVTGPILGILDVERYEDDEIRLEPGERLLLYTDGVTEARCPAGEQFGTERLAALLQEHAGLSADRLCETVVRTVDERQVGTRDDDATVLVLHRKR